MSSARRLATRLMVGASVSAAVMLAPSPAQSASCDGLEGLVAISGSRTEALVALPAALAGQVVGPASVSVQQGGLRVPVLAFERTDAALVDVAVVIDTSRQAAGSHRASARAARALLEGLPAEASATVVTSGRVAELAHPFRRGPQSALAALSQLDRGGKSALRDAVSLGLQQFPANPARQQDIVVVASGPDQTSAVTWKRLSTLLDRRGVSLNVLDLSSTASLPGGRDRCPPAGLPADPVAAGASAAASILDRRRLILPATDAVEPLVVTVSQGGVSASATLARRGDTAVAGVKFGRTPTVGAGPEALLLALVGGLLVLGAATSIVLLRTSQGGAVRAATAEVSRATRARFGEGSVPDQARRVPRAEGRRRLDDAWVDLNAAISSTLDSRGLAELEARAEAAQRVIATSREASLRERMASRDRALMRREHTVRRAQEQMAIERAREARLALAEALDAPALQGPALSEDVSSAEDARFIAAASRRFEAERAAAEAMLIARQEEEAAALAVEARQATEAAIAEAEERARQRRHQPEPVAPAVVAEQALRGEPADSGAIGGPDQVVVAEDPAAAAEVLLPVPDAATAPELEVEPEVVAELEVEPEVVAELEVEPESEVEPEVAAELEVEPEVAAELEADPELERDYVDLGSTRDRSLVRGAIGRAASKAVSASSGSPRALLVKRVDGRPKLVRREEVPSDEPPGLDDEPWRGSGQPPRSGGAPDDVDPPAAAGAKPWERVLSGRGDALSSTRIARALVIAGLPVTVAVRTAADPSWWLGVLPALALLLAVVVAGLGCWWAWTATRAPRAVLRRHTEELRQAAALEGIRVEHATRLLSHIGGPDSSDAWDRFETWTGLSVPLPTRASTAADMDPTALVRLLVARQRITPPHSHKLLTGTLVPAALCVLPAMLLVALV